MRMSPMNAENRNGSRKNRVPQKTLVTGSSMLAKEAFEEPTARTPFVMRTNAMLLISPMVIKPMQGNGEAGTAEERRNIIWMQITREAPKAMAAILG